MMPSRPDHKPSNDLPLLGAPCKRMRDCSLRIIRFLQKGHQLLVMALIQRVRKAYVALAVPVSTCNVQPSRSLPTCVRVGALKSKP